MVRHTDLNTDCFGKRGTAMRILRTIRNYICYCGIEKDEYNALKKDAYVSNFKVWRVLHFLMAAVFGGLFVISLFSTLMSVNRIFYLLAFLYSSAAVGCFFILKKDSLAAQLIIYLSISLLFLLGGLITQNKPEIPAMTFVALLLVTPMFMIDKPYFMAIELCAASAVFLTWMHAVKPHDIWQYDTINVLTYTVVGIFLHIIANSIRIQEFVLTREINIQKDLDEMTGLNNKGAMTRAINEFLADHSSDRGIMFLLDVDRFKAINDTYGHDTGDRVIAQLGIFLGSKFTHSEITGRFGGDEFIVFIRNTNDLEAARRIAEDIITGASEAVELPDRNQRISISIGIAIYHGYEKNYSEIFRNADTALYQAKADPDHRFRIYE